MTVRVGWKKVSIAFISVILIILVILGTNITAFAAGGGGSGSSWGTDGYAYGDPTWIGHGVRVYPTPLTEETGDAGIFKNRADRCRDEQWAMYYNIPPYTGGVTPMASLQARSGELTLFDISSQVRTLNTGGSNVFLDWLSRGISVDGIGAELESVFRNEIISNPDKYSAFWSGYEAELKRSNNDETTQGQIELWREEIAAGKLGIIVEITTIFNLPMDGGYIPTAITVQDFLWIHSETVGDIYLTDDIKVNTEQRYIKSVPNYTTALGCYGSGSASGQCTNAVCASMGHLRFALGMPVVAVAPRAFPYPKNDDYAAIAKDTYWGWAYYQFGEIKLPKIKLIETHVYKVDGIEVDREIVANESYPDKPTFVSTPSPRGSCRVTPETKSKHGTTYQFVGYKYATNKRDPVTDNEINPAIDSGSSDEPNICVNTGVLNPDGSYTIHVEAEFNAEPEYVDSTPQPNIIEEWELSKFFQNFAMFRADGQYLRSNITTSAGIYYPCNGHSRKDPVTGKTYDVYCRKAQATSGSAGSGLTYTWNRLSAGMEIVKGGSENYIWKSLPLSASRLGAQTQYDVRPSAQRGYGHSDDDRSSLWVSKTRIGELINIAQWKNSVPSALSRYFASDNFPKTGTVPNYKMPNAGSRLKNSSDVISANVTSVSADTWARNQVSGSYGHTSYVDSYTFHGTGVNYTPVTVSFRRYNPRANEESAIPQSMEMYIDAPQSNSNFCSLWFTTQLPKTLTRSGFGSAYKNAVDGRPVLRIHTEVDMTYDDRGTVEPSPTVAALEANRDDVIAVGDVPRYIRPVSYHGIEISANRNPKVSSSTIATDSRAIALSNKFSWGNLHRPIIYSGGDLNIGIDQRNLVTVTSWVLDFNNDTVKSAWGNDFWSAEDIHKRYKENIDFQTNAKVNINNKEMKLIDDNRFNLGGSRVTVTSSTKREYTITINGHSWSSSPTLPSGVAGKLRLDDLVQVFADHEGRSYPTNLNHNIDGGRGWYTEDSTVLKVVWIEETLTLPNVMFSEKIPITLAPPTPSNYNQLFSNGYSGRIDWEFVLNSVGTSLSPFSPDGGGITLVPYSRIGAGMTEFVIADANVLDARQGGRN